MDFKFPAPCGGPPVLSYLDQSMKLSHKLQARAPLEQTTKHYAPTFDSDSEGSDSDWEDDSSTFSDITFHRRHISVPSSVSSGGTAKKALLSIAIERQRAAAAQAEKIAHRNRKRYNGPHVHFMSESAILEEEEESVAENRPADQQIEAATEAQAAG